MSESTFICETCGAQHAPSVQPPARCAICSDDRQYVGSGATDRGWVSFMRSCPNLIPLPESTVGEMVAALEPWPFERLYGGWLGRVVDGDAKAAVRRSAERYRRALTAGFSD